MYIEGIPVRAVLAMGGYTELQTYKEERIRLARSLPPTGAQPLWDARWLLVHPDGDRSRNIIEKYDIRYIVLHKDSSDRLASLRGAGGPIPGGLRERYRGDRRTTSVAFS